MARPEIVVLVPRRQDHGERDDLWRWVRARLNVELPRWRIVEGHHDGSDPFERARAINRAARDAGRWDVALIADSDTFAPTEQLRAAVRQARATRSIVLAYNEYRYLSLAATGRVLDGRPLHDWWGDVDDVMRDSCSGLVAVTRSCWERVAGFDERFVGWGFEDVAFSIACQTLCGPISRIEGPLFHLHHDRTHAAHELPTYTANRALFERYAAAHDNREATQRLIDERTP